jgi:Methane oxygenase PmoA
MGSPDRCQENYKRSDFALQRQNGQQAEIFRPGKDESLLGLRTHAAGCMPDRRVFLKPVSHSVVPIESYFCAEQNDMPGAETMSNAVFPRAVCFLACVIVPLLLPAAAEADAFRLVVRAGEHDRPETPVVARIDTPVANGLYVLHPSDPGRRVFAQVFQDGPNRYLATTIRALKRQQELTFSLLPPERVPDRDAAQITFVPTDRNLKVHRNQRLLTELHVDDAASKPFFFPLIGPTGASYTRAYPMLTVAGEDNDHPHQKSCWFTHGNVNGIDFWSEGARAGKTRQTALHQIVSGRVLGRFRTQNDWLAPDSHKVCEDERVVTAYCAEPATLIDFEITLRASSGPVTFRDTKEGMFGLRVASSMDVDKHTGGRITNAEGLHDEKAWGQASAWVDYLGPVNGKTVGIAVLNHPTSFRYPTTWHVRPYGLFAANPFGWHDFGRSERGDYTVAAGQSITFRYRVILHEGDTASAGVPQLFDAYANPPALVVETGS